jgi:hypothetical protein
MVADVSNNRIQGRILKIFVPRPYLLQEIVVARMQGPKKEHHQKNRRNVYLAPCHIIHHPVKVQTKGHNLLGPGPIVIEQLLELSQQGTYVTYPYLESLRHRELSPIRFTRYLFTAKINM